jgi:ribonuclease HII
VRLRGLTDSKLLRADQRERFFDVIHAIADVGVGIASVEEIDRLNILRADMLAMRRAVESLPSAPDTALVDGRAVPSVACAVETLIKGDRRSLSIAAASVIAKVVRDRLMWALAKEYPGYGWQTNVGYGTDAHYLGLLRKGPSEHHRLSFAPLTTVFRADGPAAARYRFGHLATRPELTQIELLELRRDLHAVFDGDGFHLGQLKSRRGCWTFQATGYGDDGELVAGGGPCAGCHGQDVPAPNSGILRARLTKILAELRSSRGNPSRLSLSHV